MPFQTFLIQHHILKKLEWPKVVKSRYIYCGHGIGGHLSIAFIEHKINHES